MEDRIIQRRLEIAKQLYDDQIESKSKSFDTLNSVVTIYALLTGFAAYLVAGLNDAGGLHDSVWGVAFFIAGILSLVIGSAFAGRNIVLGTTYQLVDDAKGIDEAIVSGTRSLGPEYQSEALNAINMALIDRYCQAVDHNVPLIRKRDGRYNASIKFAVLALIFLFFCAVCKVLNELSFRPEVQRVKIEGPVNVMSENNNKNTQSTVSQSQVTNQIVEKPAVTINLPQNSLANESRSLQSDQTAIHAKSSGNANR